MSERIFGYTFQEIEAWQQGVRPLHRVVPPSPAPDKNPPPTQQDFELLEKHGIEGLRRLYFLATIDRLEKHGFLEEK